MLKLREGVPEQPALWYAATLKEANPGNDAIAMELDPVVVQAGLPTAPTAFVEGEEMGVPLHVAPI